MLLIGFLAIYFNFILIKAEPITKVIGNWAYSIDNDRKLKWSEALDACKDKNMRLLSLESAEKAEQLNEFLKTEGFVDTEKPGVDYIYWTSGNDRQNEGKFVWQSTNQEFTFTNWLPERPDNWRNDENCVEMGYLELGKWNDNRCWYHRPFICERDISSSDGSTNF